MYDEYQEWYEDKYPSDEDFMLDEFFGEDPYDYAYPDEDDYIRVFGEDEPVWEE